jgi:hypothetical protein
MALAAPSNARAGWREKSKTTLAQRPRLGLFVYFIPIRLHGNRQLVARISGSGPATRVQVQFEFQFKGDAEWGSRKQSNTESTSF